MTDYQTLATSYAQQAGIDPQVFVNQIQAESGFNPNAVSPAGAIGIAQFMPQTAAGLGLNPKDPIASLRAAASYDARNLKTYNGDYAKMLAAYNAGGGSVNNAVSQYGSNWLAHMPAETQKYVNNIMSRKGPNKNPLNQQNTQASTGSPILDTIKVWGEYLVIYVLSVALIVIGVLLLAGKQVFQVAKKVM